MKVCEACKIIELNKNKKYINQNKQEVIRGEIYYADLNGATQMGKSVQAGKRPVLIVSNNTGNKYSPNINVLPITSKIKKMVTHIEIRVNFLEEPSFIICENTMTIGKEKLIERKGMCPKEIVQQVDKTINRQLKTISYTEEEIKNEIRHYKEVLERYNQTKDNFFKELLKNTMSNLEDMAFYSYMPLNKLMMRYGDLTVQVQ